jgi:hypothetical protein
MCIQFKECQSMSTFQNTKVQYTVYIEQQFYQFCIVAKSVLLDWLWWGENMSQNYGHQRACFSSPGWYVSMEAMVMILPARDNSQLANQSSLTVLPAETSGASRRNGRRSENFAYQYLKYLKGSLTCRKILRRGTSGFTSHPKEGVLRILSPLKIHRLCWVWTRDPWGQVY